MKPKKSMKRKVVAEARHAPWRTAAESRAAQMRWWKPVCSMLAHLLGGGLGDEARVVMARIEGWVEGGEWRVASGEWWVVSGAWWVVGGEGQGGVGQARWKGRWAAWAVAARAAAHVTAMMSVTANFHAFSSVLMP